MKNNQEKNIKKDKESSWFFGVFNSQSTSGAGYCTPDQCFINGPQTFSTTSLISPQTLHHTELRNATLISDVFNSIKLSELFTPELIQLFTDAAQQGLLVSVLITLANEGVTDYLKGRYYHPDEIYWINQAIRALLLITLGSSPVTVLTTPIASYLLNQYGGLSKETSNHIATGLTLGINLVTTPISLIDASVSIGASVGASLLGSAIAKSGYNYFRNTFFESKKMTHTQDEEPQNVAQCTN